MSQKHTNNLSTILYLVPILLLSHFVPAGLLYVYTHLMCIIISVSPSTHSEHIQKKNNMFYYSQKNIVFREGAWHSKVKGVNILVCIDCRWLTHDSPKRSLLESINVSLLHLASDGDSPSYKDDKWQCYRANNKCTTISQPPSCSDY